MSPIWRLCALGVLLLVIVGCDQALTTANNSQWLCPVGWVPHELGGCGPALLLCAPGGGAASGGCERSSSSSQSDAGLVREYDGGLSGRWPPTEWTPDAGAGACPSTWRRVADGECDPAVPADCPEGSAGLPGGRCTHTTTVDCPVGEWTDPGPDALGSRVVHVRASADPSVADGSEARPYSTVTDGVRGAGDGGWVLVASGDYRESLLVTGRAHIIGRCAMLTRLLPPGAGSPALRVAGAGANVEARGITLRGGTRGLEVALGASATLWSASIEDSGGAALYASGERTTVHMSDVRIRCSGDVPDRAGAGAVVEGGASLALDRVALRGCAKVGVSARGAGSALTLQDVTIEQTAAGVGADSGGALLAREGARVTANRVLVAGHAANGVLADGPGSEVEVTDAVVRGGAVSARQSGVGMAAVGGASLVATRVLLDANRELGVLAFQTGSRVELRETLVRGTLALDGNVRGYGMAVSGGATATVSSARFEENQNYGVWVGLAGSSLRIEESAVRRTLIGEGRAGKGIEAFCGGSVVASRVLVEDNHNTGVGAIGRDPERNCPSSVMAAVTLRDSVVRGTLPRRDGTGGRGIAAQHGAVLRVERVRLEGNHETGAMAFNGSEINLSDVVVSGTRPREDGTLGLGLAAFGLDLGGSTLVATRVLISNVFEAGVVAAGAGTSATLTDLIVQDVHPSARGFGMGISVTAGALVEVRRVAVARVSGAALMAAFVRDALAGGGRLRGSEVFVTDVSPSAIQYREFGSMEPAGAAVSYSVYVGGVCSVDLQDFTLVNSGYGFFHSGGALRLADGVIARQSMALGARGGLSGTSDVLRVDSRSNQRSDVVLAPDLPEALLPPPLGL